MPKQPKKNYSHRFQVGVIDEIKKRADKENRTETNYIETILIKYINDNPRKTENG